MPADTIGNSISSFLNKTDQVSQKYRNVQLESEAADRFGRSSSVARATSVARQFEPSSSTFMRGGSVARGFEVIIDRDIVCNNLGVTNMLQTSSRDPFYSQITRPPTVTRQPQSLLSPHSSVMETIAQSNLLSPSQSKNVLRENKNGNSKFRSLEVIRKGKYMYFDIENKSLGWMQLDIKWTRSSSWRHPRGRWKHPGWYFWWWGKHWGHRDSFLHLLI